MLHFCSGSVFYYTIIACISITHCHCHLQNKLVLFAYETIMYQECQERQVRWDRELVPGKSFPNENGKILKELTWLFFCLFVLLCFFIFQSLSRVSLWPHRLWHTRFPCPSLSPRICSNSCPLSQWCYLILSSSAALFSFCLIFICTQKSFSTDVL